MTRVKEYRNYWCGCLRCFFCALFYNGNSFLRWSAATQFTLVIFTVAAPIVPWLKISYSTGNHLERTRLVFNFFDANANNFIEYDEFNLALKDKNYVFFGTYTRTDSELMQALLADQNSACMSQLLSDLQATCTVGGRARCLHRTQWDAEGNRLLDNPTKLQKCMDMLLDATYVKTTQDTCVQAYVNKWLTDGDGSNEHQCLQQTKVDIYEFTLHDRQLLPGLPEDEQMAPNYCINTTVNMYLSIYGSMTVEMKLTTAYDGDSPRCHGFNGLTPLKNFTCITILDYFSNIGVDIEYTPTSLSTILFGGSATAAPQQCRDMGSWILDVFASQAVDNGCGVQCTPGGKAVLDAGCVESDALMRIHNRYVNAPFTPTCRVRQGSNIRGDFCEGENLCPACSYPTNASASEASARFRAHGGTTGLSAVYDTLCGMHSTIFLNQIIQDVLRDRATQGQRLDEKAALVKTLSAQCAAKRASGDYLNGVIRVTAPTAQMASWGAAAGGELACSCPFEGDCGACVVACADATFPSSERRLRYPSHFNCSTGFDAVTAVTGSAGFDPLQTPGGRWTCDTVRNPGCGGRWRGMAPRAMPFLSTHRDYGAPQPVQALMQVFGVLCPVSMAILSLYVAAFLLQWHNIYLVWLNVRASHDLSIDAAWQQEKLVIYSSIFVFLVAAVPASLYGGYVNVFADVARWGATHELQPGWYLSLTTAIIGLLPLYGAWAIVRARPVEWKNALGRFDVVDSRPGGWARRFLDALLFRGGDGSTSSGGGSWAHEHQRFGSVAPAPPNFKG